MMKEMGDTEKQRVVEQRKTLGEKGLAEKAKALEEATQDNEVMESFQNSNFNWTYDVNSGVLLKRWGKKGMDLENKNPKRSYTHDNDVMESFKNSNF